MKRLRRYWIRFTHIECVLCGRGKTIRERIYGKPRPKRANLRHIYQQEVCGYCELGEF